MSINKTHSYKQMCKQFLANGIVIIIMCTFSILIKWYLLLFFWIFFSLLFIVISILSLINIADIELNDDHFCFVVMYKTLFFTYDNTNITYIDRCKSPIKFVIYINGKKYNLAYSTENQDKIKILLEKTNSSLTATKFTNMMKSYIIKPGALDY